MAFLVAIFDEDVEWVGEVRLMTSSGMVPAPTPLSEGIGGTPSSCLLIMGKFLLVLISLRCIKC